MVKMSLIRNYDKDQQHLPSVFMAISCCTLILFSTPACTKRFNCVTWELCIDLKCLFSSFFNCFLKRVFGQAKTGIDFLLGFASLCDTASWADTFFIRQQHLVRTYWQEVDAEHAVSCTISLWQKQQSILLNLQSATFKCCTSARLGNTTCAIMDLRLKVWTMATWMIECESYCLERGKFSHLLKKGFGNVHVGFFYFTSHHNSITWHGQCHAQCIVACVHPCRI